MNKVVFTGVDTHPIRSLALMFQSIGWEVSMLTDKALHKLQSQGYTGGVMADLLDNMGYVKADLPHATEEDLKDCDLFIEIKRLDADSIIPLYPRLKGKVMLFVINGGKDDYDDYGDHYPVITNNFWIEKNSFRVWQPFDNIHNLSPRETPDIFEPPMGLLHNARNWGFGDMMDGAIAKTGLRIFGSYGSPMGILKNDKLGEYFANTLAFVHLKASDCPGYALYEALASAVPVVVTELFIKRMRFQDMYEDGVTCLTWGKTSFSVSEGKITEYIDASRDTMIQEIADCLEKLKNPAYNKKIGLAGHERWKKLTTWDKNKQKNFAQFISDHL